MWSVRLLSPVANTRSTMASLGLAPNDEARQDAAMITLWLARPAQSIPLLLVAALVAVCASGCFTTEIIDDISTEIRIESTDFSADVVEVRKRFRFTYDPGDASGLYLLDARMAALDPSGIDLSMIHRISIYVVDTDDQRTLVAFGEGFEEGQTNDTLEIAYFDDLRRFARDDSRVVFVFAVEPSPWGRPFPDEGITLSAVASLEIQL
jgi:hypothetical protein